MQPRLNLSIRYNSCTMIFECEHCKQKHDASYGSGRFCSTYCAHSWSTTYRDRLEINRKTAVTARRLGIRPIPPSEMSLELRERWLQGIRNGRLKLAAHSAAQPWRQASYTERRRRVFAEQGEACLCGISSWQGISITLELHHIDADHANWDRENLVLLCPNCHSQTDNYRSKGKITNPKGSRARDRLQAKPLVVEAGLEPAILTLKE